MRWLVAKIRAIGHAPAEDAAGAVVYSSRQTGASAPCNSIAGQRRAVCAANAGARYSTVRGAAFHVAGPDGPDYPVHVAAGPPVDALAIATWRRRRAWAAVGAGDLAALAPALGATGRAIVIEANGAGPGSGAAATLQAALSRRGVRARLVCWPGCSPADGLTDEWQERAAFAQADGMDCREADAAAWRAMPAA